MINWVLWAGMALSGVIVLGSGFVLATIGRTGAGCVDGGPSPIANKASLAFAVGIALGALTGVGVLLA